MLTKEDDDMPSIQAKMISGMFKLIGVNLIVLLLYWLQEMRHIRAATNR